MNRDIIMEGIQHALLVTEGSDRPCQGNSSVPAEMQDENVRRRESEPSFSVAVVYIHSVEPDLLAEEVCRKVRVKQGFSTVCTRWTHRHVEEVAFVVARFRRARPRSEPVSMQRTVVSSLVTVAVKPQTLWR